ncbi:MAG TPA: site-specific DNA-methyltransferase [Candidatus Kapabacteria bacterium]|nr:site-specific DNA-methyltransferase [Candidatus Kapabacteria bacterium]HPO61730.1 site-specific DNA-methyltransferase [Candidatus Kapabacteria bacterium]
MKNIQLFNDDCLNILKLIPEKSIDLIFADPPYNLSGEGYLTTQNGKVAKLNKGDWDIIEDIHKFNEEWIQECIHVLSDTGTIWISGTLHNHPSVGVVLKKLGLWIINDVIWFKRNATPLLSSNRLAPSTELIWVASKSKKYLFNYDIAKKINGGKQMKNLWEINAERHKTKHPTEKPESLLQRIILLGSNEGQTVLDPFTGSGTTGVVAKKLNRNFIGIEKSKEYYEIAKNRIDYLDEDFKVFHNCININTNNYNSVEKEKKLF